MELFTPGHSIAGATKRFFSTSVNFFPSHPMMKWTCTAVKQKGEIGGAVLKTSVNTKEKYAGREENGCRVLLIIGVREQTDSHTLYIEYNCY